jgi:hypothetical protein
LILLKLKTSSTIAGDTALKTNKILLFIGTHKSSMGELDLGSFARFDLPYDRIE